MMNTLLLDTLERTLETETFAIVDTSSLLSLRGYGDRDLLSEIYDCRTISAIPLAVLEKKLQSLMQLNRMLQKPSARVTREVLKEFERGVNIEQRTLDTKKRNCKEDGENFDYAQSEDCSETSEDLCAQIKEESFKQLQLLRRRTINFQNYAVQQKLFEFFKYLSTTVDLQSRGTKKHWKIGLKGKEHEYLYGDESIEAALFYRVLLEEKDKDSTAVITTDHDIKRNVRTACILFSTVAPELFAEKTKHHPFKVYLLDGEGEKTRYRPFVDTAHNPSIGTLEGLTRIAGEKNTSSALEAAYDVFNTVC